MKAKHAITLGLVAGACLGLPACGGGSSGTAMQQPTPMPLDEPTALTTQQVLQDASTSSEVSDPFVVANAVTVADPDDQTSDPANVTS